MILSELLLRFQSKMRLTTVEPAEMLLSITSASAVAVEYPSPRNDSSIAAALGGAWRTLSSVTIDLPRLRRVLVDQSRRRMYGAPRFSKDYPESSIPAIQFA